MGRRNPRFARTTRSRAVPGVDLRDCDAQVRGRDPGQHAPEAARRAGRRPANGVDQWTSLTSEQQIDLATAIRGLPPIHRAAVHLFYREDLSVEEIASVLGIPAGTVKSRLHHAREALKRQLAAAAPGRNETESRKRGIS